MLDRFLHNMFRISTTKINYGKVLIIFIHHQVVGYSWIQLPFIHYEYDVLLLGVTACGKTLPLFIEAVIIKKNVLSSDLNVDIYFARESGCEVLWWARLSVCICVRLCVCVCLSVCLSVGKHTSGATRAIFTKFSPAALLAEQSSGI